MRSLYNFIIKPVNKRYNNSVKIENKELILNTSVDQHLYVNKSAEIIETPLAYNTPIKKGDIVYVHHNLFRRWYDQKGRERNSATFFKNDLFFCNPEQIYMYNNKPHLDYCFVKPILDLDSLDKKKEKELQGVLKHGNIKEVPVDSLITFTPNSEFEFLINGERLYCMKLNDIAIKHERKGDEKEYNPSWTISSERTDKSSEGTDCGHGRRCDCGPTKERSCHQEVSNF